VSKPAGPLAAVLESRLGKRTDGIRRFHDAFVSRLAESQASDTIEKRSQREIGGTVRSLFQRLTTMPQNARNRFMGGALGADDESYCRAGHPASDVLLHPTVSHYSSLSATEYKNQTHILEPI